MSGGTDIVLEQLGTGWWSLLHIFTVAYSAFFLVPHTIAGAFLAPGVPFTCREPLVVDPLYYNNVASINSTDFSTTVSNTSASDGCTYMVEGGEEVECGEYDFDNSTYVSTITSEFQLVCGREYLKTSYQSLYMFGVFIGAPINGFLADKFGRKVVFSWGTLAFLVVALGTTWLPRLPLLLLSRILLGIIHAFVCFGGFIVVIEMAEPKYRTMIGFAIYVFWSLGTSWYGLLAYLVRSWRLLQLLISIPGILMLPALWMLDESPRWLVVKGRKEEASKIFHRAARWHKVTLPSDTEMLGLADTPETPKMEEGDRSFGTMVKGLIDSAFVLLKTPKLRHITLLLYLSYIVGSMVYFGLSLSGGSLSDNPFAYMALSGLMEMPAYTLTIPVVEKFGRRAPAISCFLFCGVALIALAVIPEEHMTAIMTLALIGKIGITGAFQIIIFFSSELFPTEVRSRGIGTCFMLSRVGSMLAPFITDIVGSRHAWAPSVVFGVASLLAAMAALLLPETLGQPLPDTVLELEACRRVSRPWIQNLIPWKKHSIVTDAEEEKDPAKVVA